MCHFCYIPETYGPNSVLSRPQINKHSRIRRIYRIIYQSFGEKAWPYKKYRADGWGRSNTIVKVAIGKRLGLLITFAISTIERDGKAYPIIPGVMCSVVIKTRRKTILSSLLKPINRARQEAMSER